MPLLNLAVLKGQTWSNEQSVLQTLEENPPGLSQLTCLVPMLTFLGLNPTPVFTKPSLGLRVMLGLQAKL